MSRKRILKGKAQMQTIITERGKTSPPQPASKLDKEITTGSRSYVRVRGLAPIKQPHMK